MQIICKFCPYSLTLSEYTDIMDVYPITADGGYRHVIEKWTEDLSCENITVAASDKSGRLRCIPISGKSGCRAVGQRLVSAEGDTDRATGEGS